MKANGLELKKIKTMVEHPTVTTPIDKFLSDHFKEKGYIIAYMFNEVLIGYYDEGRYRFYNDKTIEEKYLQKLRVFNESKELYVWRSNGGFRARLRIDGEGEDTNVVDACQLIWGTRSELHRDFTKLQEDGRGITLFVPLKIKLDDERRRPFLKTRSYIGFTRAFQATYVDCRFIGFDNNYKED